MRCRISASTNRSRPNKPRRSSASSTPKGDEDEPPARAALFPRALGRFRRVHRARGPSGVAFADLRANDEIVQPFIVTFIHDVIATAAAAALGLPFGYFLARNPTFDKAYRGWLAAAFAAPLVLLYPLFLVFFGRSYFTVVLMSTIVAFVPIAIHARDAFLGVPPVLLNVGKGFNVDKIQRFRLIELPAAVPTTFIW